MLAKSLRVSTNTKGPCVATATGWRSRGACTTGNSAAMAACTAAIFWVSDCTHSKPTVLANACKSPTGNAQRGTAGIAALTGAGTAVVCAVTGAVCATCASGITGLACAVLKRLGAGWL